MSPSTQHPPPIATPNPQSTPSHTRIKVMEAQGRVHANVRKKGRLLISSTRTLNWHGKPCIVRTQGHFSKIHQGMLSKTPCAVFARKWTTRKLLFAQFMLVSCLNLAKLQNIQACHKSKRTNFSVVPQLEIVDHMI